MKIENEKHLKERLTNLNDSLKRMNLILDIGTLTRYLGAYNSEEDDETIITRVIDNIRFSDGFFGFSIYTDINKKPIITKDFVTSNYNEMFDLIENYLSTMVLETI